MVGEMERQLLSPRQPIALIAMSIVEESIPVERLWELYSYDVLRGALISRKRENTEVKGSPLPTGYKQLQMWVECNGVRKVRGIGYHRAIYAWFTGAWPTGEVDHINRNNRDNRIQNLRDVTPRKNKQNSSRFQGGVSVRPSGKWRARITIDGKRTILGTFPSKAEAQAAYQTALKELS